MHGSVERGEGSCAEKSQSLTVREQVLMKAKGGAMKRISSSANIGLVYIVVQSS